MADSAASLARTVLGRNLKVERGESVLVEAWTGALPYASAFVDEARRLGAQPTVLYEDEASWWRAVDARRFGGFKRLSAAERAAVEAADAYVYFWGPGDLPRATAIPDAIGNRLFAYNQGWYASARKGGLRGCRMTLGWASDATARAIGVSGPGWRARLTAAGMANARAMGARGQRVSRALSRGSKLRIRHPNGTDVTIPLRVVASRVDSGIAQGASRGRPMGMMANNPSGQVIVALDPGATSGTVVSNRAVYNFGNLSKFSGVRWTFERGALVAHEVGVGREAFESGFAKAPAGRDRLSFLSIGLNPLARELPPCEDCEEGSVLLGVGGNAQFGGKVRNPFVGYALVAGGTVEVDGRTIARGGRVR